MLPPWIRRVCIRLQDILLGLFIYLPIFFLYLKRGIARYRASVSEGSESQILNLDCKVVLVTGGNAGIGYYTVKHLASMGAKVYIASRSETRVKAAIKRIIEENPSISPDKLVWLCLDLSSQHQVVDAALELRSKERRLDILVNNAGVNPYNYSKTSDGFDKTMAVNHIGHWTLTYCLLPLLNATAEQKGSDVRIVTVSSSGHAVRMPSNHFTTDQFLQYSGASPGWEDSNLAQHRRYGSSKQANVIFAAELQRRLDAEDVDIISISLDPGFVGTSGAVDVVPLMARPLVRFLFDKPERGADTSLFAATAEMVKGNSSRWKGSYTDGPGQMGIPSIPQDVTVHRKLWDITESAVMATGALNKLKSTS